ncbi:MAG: methyl-accepting chemotaxis protein [Firmicutes bacterium]|nr:methyl-accepting chemotaxis protein [Bacillota bacterium]
MIASITYFSIYLSSLVQEEFISSTSKQIQQVNNAVNVFFESISENVEFLAENVSVKSVDDTITSYINDPGGADGLIQMSPSLSSGLEKEIYNVYANYAESHPRSAYVYMATDNAGYIQWPDGKIMSNYDPREKPFYQTAMENKGDVARIDPYYFPADDVFLITTTTTITNDAGEVIGVQALDVTLEIVTDIIKDIRIEKTGYIVVTDSEGTIIAHPKNAKMNGENIQELKNEQLNTVVNMNTGVFETNIDGKDSFVNVFTSAETGWKFIAIVEKAELMEKFIGIAKQILLLSGLFLLVIVCLATFIANKISKPITASASYAQEIANGNLKVDDINIKQNDENGILIDSLHKMKESLKTVILGLKDSSVNLTESTKQLADQSQQTSAGASETAATVSEIACTIEQVSSNVNEVANLSERVSKEAEQGSKGVERVTGQMELIYCSNDVASKVVEELAKTLNQVNSIVYLITSIAEQTNLLALNAAIEAARAGEQGRGFAVVAEEVRKLAEQSANASKDITNLIQQVHAESQKAVEAMSEGSRQVKEGVTVVEEVGNNFMGIANSIEILVKQIQDVAAASEQVAAGIQNVSATAEEQTAAMEEISASNEQLNLMANKLNKMIDKFTV